MKPVLISGVLAALFALVLPVQAGASADAGSLIVEASQHLSRDEAVEAEVLLRKALDQGAARKAIAAYMGSALLKQEKPRQARRWLERGAFAPASAAFGFRALALLERTQGNLHAAGKAYDRAIAVTPRDATLWVEVARLRYIGGEHLLAIRAAEHALKLDLANVRALELKGQIERDRVGLVAALPWFEKAHRLAPEDISVLGEYAATAGEIGQASRMLQLTRRMLELDPDNARAFYLQAVMAARAGNYRLARVLMNKTLGKYRRVPGAMLLEGVIELGNGNYTLAVEALSPLQRKQPANARVRHLLARALFLGGEHKYLVERFATIAREPGAAPYLQMLVARAYENLGQRNLAAPYLEAAAQVRTRAVQPVASGSRIGELLASGQTAAAQDLVLTWLADNPDYFDHLTLAGDVALAKGSARSAMYYYKRAARIRMPESLMERRFQAMLMAGDMRQAHALVEAYLANHPRSASAMRLAGWLSAYTGDWDRARGIYETLRMNGAGRDVQLLSDLALTQLRTGDTIAAEESARTAYRLHRSNPVAAQALGMSLVGNQDHKPVARALLEKARAIMGDNPALAEARRKLRTSTKG